MSGLNSATIERAFQQAGLKSLPQDAYEQMASYYDILERWNSRLSLTALRTPEQILKRHFVECAFAAQRLPGDVRSLLDYGSGAGFPGLVIAICSPLIRVTVAEAHSKKASFLSDVVRSLSLRAEVFSERVEEMPSKQRYHAVTMRAVEKMGEAIRIAIPHVERYLVLLTGEKLVPTYASLLPEMAFQKPIFMPGSDQSVMAVAVPRGTSL